MSSPSEKGRAAEIQSSIARLLHEDWDPIGVRGIPEAHSEYDGYVGGVYRLLSQGASPEAIAAHLHSIERDQMGLQTTGSSTEARLAVARKLRALDIAL
jgi:hypothetical protein